MDGEREGALPVAAESQSGVIFGTQMLGVSRPMGPTIPESESRLFNRLRRHLRFGVPAPGTKPKSGQDETLISPSETKRFASRVISRSNPYGR
jgi:hypothetical protein